MADADHDVIRLGIPADHEWGRVARTAVRTLATRIGFGYREVEDLTLAVDEMLILLLRPDLRPGGRITVILTRQPGGLEIRAETTATATGPPRPTETDRLHHLVSPIVDEVELSTDARRVVVAKRYA